MIASASVHTGSAPFDSDKSVSVKFHEFLRLDRYSFGYRLPRHEYTEHAVGSRGDYKLCRILISFVLEGDQIVLVILHLWQPVDDELVSFASCQTQSSERIFKERGGILALYAESLAEIVACISLAFPEETVELSSAIICQSDFGGGCYSPPV